MEARPEAATLDHPRSPSIGRRFGSGALTSDIWGQASDPSRPDKTGKHQTYPVRNTDHHHTAPSRPRPAPRVQQPPRLLHAAILESFVGVAHVARTALRRVHAPARAMGADGHHRANPQQRHGDGTHRLRKEECDHRLRHRSSARRVRQRVDSGIAQSRRGCGDHSRRTRPGRCGCTRRLGTDSAIREIRGAPGTRTSTQTNSYVVVRVVHVHGRCPAVRHPRGESRRASRWSRRSGRHRRHLPTAELHADRRPVGERRNVVVVVLFRWLRPAAAAAPRSSARCLRAALDHADIEASRATGRWPGPCPSSYATPCRETGGAPVAVWLLPDDATSRSTTLFRVVAEEVSVDLSATPYEHSSAERRRAHARTRPAARRLELAHVARGRAMVHGHQRRNRWRDR